MESVTPNMPKPKHKPAAQYRKHDVSKSLIPQFDAKDGISTQNWNVLFIDR